MAVDIEALSAPRKRCNRCGEEKPWTQDYFRRRQKRRADGSIAYYGFLPTCKACNIQALRAYDAKKKAETAAGREPPPPVAKALGKLPLPKVAKPSFRGVLEAKAEAKWNKLAEKMIDTALGNGKDSAAMLKLVAAYMLGTPREASEDHGPSEFWHALLAGARARDAGAETDLGPADADLGDDPDSE